MERADLGQWKSKEVARLLALVEAERRYYQEILAELPVAVAVVSESLRVVSVNRRCQRLLGVRQSELADNPVDEVIPVAGIADAMASVLADPRTTRKIPGELGGRRVRVSAQALRSWEDAESREILLVIEDLTGEAPASQSPVEEVAHNLDAVLWRRDPATLCFSFVSRGGAATLGWPKEAWLAAREIWPEFVACEDRRRYADFYSGLAAAGGTRSLEYEALGADGRRIWLRDTVTVTKGCGGQVESVCGMTVDFTERRIREEQAMQARALDALGRLASRATHDFNNLLMIIAGYAEELRSSLPPTHENRSDLEEILKATDRVSHLASQMLAFARPDAAQPAPVTVNALLTGVEQRLRAILGESVALKLICGSEAGEAIVDRERLEQGLESLTERVRGLGDKVTAVRIESSAVRFGREFPGREEEGPQPGPYVRITMSDDGPALDAEARRRVFEPVFATPEKTGAAGIGLASFYRLLRMSGGALEVDSRPGTGTTFHIYVPRVGEVETPEASQTAQFETVLVVEDEVSIRSLVRKILTREGFRVLEAGGGEEALEIARGYGEPIHLLITDIMMPGIKGPELAERLQAERPGVKLIYISGFAGDAALRNGDQTILLQKPFSHDALVGAVRTVLGSAQGPERPETFRASATENS